jgi:hypothetical protein
MTKLNIVLSVAAGLFGGVLSHYAWTQPVQAQARIPAPKEIRAQSFILVNDKDQVEGVFSFEESKAGRPTVTLFDGKGREIWSAGGDRLHPLIANDTVNPK